MAVLVPNTLSNAPLKYLGFQAGAALAEQQEE
jgi:hypothetical protein